jgi:hypothetical protein
MVKFFTALLSFSQITNSLKEGFLEDLHLYLRLWNFHIQDFLESRDIVLNFVLVKLINE